MDPPQKFSETAYRRDNLIELVFQFQIQTDSLDGTLPDGVDAVEQALLGT